MEALTPEDVAILDAESLVIAGHTCKVIVVENGDAGSPSLEDVRRRIAGRLDQVPRFRQCLRSAPEPAWDDSKPFSIEEHVRPAPTGEGLADAAARAMAGRLDRERPLWDLEVLPDVGDGKSALVWRVHHCMADGMTMMRWASELFWDEAPPAVGSHPATQDRGREHRGAAVVLDAVRTAVSVARELQPLRPPGPFDGHVGVRREVAFARCTLADLRSIEHAAGPGVTVNDVVLAAVAGGLRRWCSEHGVSLDGARVKVPVSMHRAQGMGEPGNRDSFMFVDLPLGEPDAAERLRKVNAETRERKEHHDAEAVYDLLERLRRVAPPLARMFGRVLMNPREFAVNVSNVPGPQGEVRMLGRRVTDLYSLAEIADRHPLRIAAVSLSGVMHFGLCADPDRMAGASVVAAGIETSVAEMLASA